MRWKVLAILFFARMTMAFQFATVGALGPLYETTFQVNTTALGILIGLYFLPGVFVALPGGAFGARFGDKQIVVTGLVLMVAGAVVMAVSDSWNAQIAGRIIAGTGGVLVNVLMTKIVADWFAGREMATAMALFVNSWPAGIATALLVMPAIAGVAGLAPAVWIVAGFTLAGLCVMTLFYQNPEPVSGQKTEPSDTAEPGKSTLPGGRALGAIVSAGAAWGLFNAALAVVFSFGPANLVERGRSLIDASAATSIVIWFVMIAGFAGGVLADRSGRPLTLLFTATLVMLGATYAFPLVDNIYLVLIVLGVATGLPTGVYMSVAAQSLRPQERAKGMGVFYTTYYTPSPELT